MKTILFGLQRIFYGLICIFGSEKEVYEADYWECPTCYAKSNHECNCDEW